MYLDAILAIARFVFEGVALWPEVCANSLLLLLSYISFSLDEASNLITPPNGSHSDRELLTLLAKTELILAAQDELLKLSEESKDIQSLQRCAEIGGLKSKIRPCSMQKRERRKLYIWSRTYERKYSFSV